MAGLKRKFFFQAAAILVVAATLSGCKTTEKATIRPVGDETALLKAADTARTLGNTDEAIAGYEAAAGLSTGPVRAHLELSALYQSQGRQDDALRILQQANKLNPTSVEVMKELSYQLLRMGRGAEAGSYLAKGLGQSPKDVRLLNAYGVWLDQHGQHADAQSHYQQALELAQTTEDKDATRHNLAMSLIATKKPDDALKILEKQSKKTKGTATFRQTQALAYAMKGDDEKAYELSIQDLDREAAKENMRLYEQFRTDALDRRVLFQGAAEAARH